MISNEAFKGDGSRLVASEQQIRGYVPEEVLAFLIKNSGYYLLPDASYDPQELVDQPNGLAVRGRGATHQADVLGQLSWAPAFTYPLRLFVEAKYYSGTRRICLSTVRSAVGIIEDVDQNFQVIPGAISVTLRKRYTYRYALFSATSFDSHAAELAYAHGISLVDLSTPAFQPLRDVVRSIASSVVDSQSCGYIVRLAPLRQAVRDALNPDLDRRPLEAASLPPEVVEVLQRVRDKAELGDLLIGMPDAPFVLILKPDDLGAFLDYAREHRSHDVRIRSRLGTAATEWEMLPRYSDDYRLVFSLPPELDEWILSTGSSASRRARYLKGELLKSITVFWSQRDYDEVFRLDYSPTQTSSQIPDRADSAT